MAEILGVVAGFLGPAIELGKCIYEPIKHQFDYLCCFNNNVLNLKDEARKLKEKQDGLQMLVDTEEKNAQVILPEVKAWIADATRARAEAIETENKITTTRNGGLTLKTRYSLGRKVKKTTEGIEVREEVIETQNKITTTRNGGFTLKTRYSLGRKVKKTTEGIKELREKCDFNIISQPPPPAAWVPITLGPYSVFESRKDIEEGVMESLRDNETYIVGMCGMGGVGKTTMAKKIMNRVREEHLFEEVSTVVISHTPDSLKIQKSLAESLGLELRDESLPARAHRLHNRLSESKKKSLVVVDDVWENLNLAEIGIPCNSRCKVLLTSRDSHVLGVMNANKVHAVKELSKKEAWDLFKLYVDGCIEHENLKFIAQEVIAECKGLPVALVTAGAALKGVENASVWKDWLHQLKSNNPNGLPDILDGVYRPLRLSYEFLKNEEAKSLFLLCCLYPEDGNIPLSELAIYATGLRILRGIKSLEEARNRVCSLVQTLKSRFVLLEGKNKDHVKMHDVIRDVAIFIASEKKLIACDSETNDCTWISPHIGERIELQAGSSVFPSLRLLWIHRYSRDEELEINSQFFGGMKELNVLSIRYSSLQQLPQTTRILVNLQTLVLASCWSLESISVVGELVNLKILICRACKSIESLPIEMKRLRHLKLLELSYCRNLKTIEPGIISNLKALEELIMVGSFDEWQAENFEKGNKNAFLSELEKLSSLRLLKIEIKDSSLVTQQTSLSPNMVRFHIRIGETREFYESEIYEKRMKLVLPANITMGKGFVKCLETVEELYLKGDGSSLDFGVAKEIKVLVIEDCSLKKLVTRKIAHIAFPRLEVLKLQQLSELKEICDMDQPMPSTFLRNLRELRLERLPALEHLNVVSNFNKLSTIYVRECGKLKSLFSSLMMTRDSSLVQLKSLRIERCDMMEQVFLWNNEENQIPVIFANLKSLKLQYLPNLTSFSKGIGIIEFPVLEELEVGNPLKNFVFTTSTGDDDAVHLFCQQNKEKFARLRKLKVQGFSGMKSLFSSSTIKSGCFSQLEELEIWECEMMEEVILWNEEENQTDIDIILFPKLKLLTLHYLPRLTSLSKGIQFTAPAKMRILNCPLLESCASDDNDGYIHLFCKTHEVEFGSLKTLTIGQYNGVIRNWCPQPPMIDIFSGLSKLKIDDIEGIKILFSCSVAQNLQNMRFLQIWSCQDMVGVIEDEDDACGGKTPPFHLFPNLKERQLRRLPKLKSFCEWRCGLEFPLLTYLRISDCEALEKFTAGPLSTPVLESIHTLIDPALLGPNGVNTFLQQRFLKRKEEQKRKLQGSSVEIKEEEEHGE